MRKTFVAVGLILLGLVGLLIAVLLNRGDAAPEWPVETAVEAPAERPVRTRAPRKRTATPTTEPAPAVVEPQPEAIVHEVIAAEDASGTLTVFGPDGTTLAPQQTVRFLEFDPRTSKPEYREFKDFFDLLRHHGRALQTDDKGQVALPQFKTFAYVSAQQDEERGLQIIRPNLGQPWQIVMRVRVRIPVRVVTADGTPVSVGVALMASR